MQLQQQSFAESDAGISKGETKKIINPSSLLFDNLSIKKKNQFALK